MLDDERELLSNRNAQADLPTRIQLQHDLGMLQSVLVQLQALHKGMVMREWHSAVWVWCLARRHNLRTVPARIGATKHAHHGQVQCRGRGQGLRWCI